MRTFQKQINIPSILKIGENELENIGIYLKSASFNNIACFYSAGMEELVGEKINKSLAENSINIVHKDTINEIHIENVIHTAFSIPKDIDTLIGIGGGKALDYSKYCAHVLALPYISVPTSTSNDGFCSPGASLLVEGHRKSVNAAIPFGVILDLEIISSSPENCIFSGLGDLISKVTAGWDWKEASKRNGDLFNDFAYLISQNSVTDFLQYQQKNIRDIDFLYNLANSLLMSGISMEICNSSRPASGSEHLISHALDKISLTPRMHGIQVGIATYLCSILQNNQSELVKNFLNLTGFLNYVFNNPLNKKDFINAVKTAPSIKEKFYTILSEDKAINNALYLIENDEILIKCLV